MHPLKALTPHGLVHRREFTRRLRALGSQAQPSDNIWDALERCRYELWPETLRKRSDWTLVDVGANWGQFLRSVADFTHPAQVIAFEPLAEHRAAVEEAVALFPTGRAVMAALGETQGEVSFYRTQETAFSSVLKPAAGMERYYGAAQAVTRQETVRLTTLDAELADVGPVGLLKIDVQGYELPVLRGGREVLKRTAAVLLEINYQPHYEAAVSFEDLQAEMAAQGFRLAVVSEPSFQSGVPMWADAVYVRV